MNISPFFSQELGCTNTTQHTIDTGTAPPVKVPSRPIPFHYAERVHQQLQEMAQEGIIRPSTSPCSLCPQALRRSQDLC